MVRLQRDEGFTLSELVVVMGLLSLIMGAAYAGFQIARSGSDLSNQQSLMSREIGAPLQLADRVITQASGFDTTYPGVTKYRCAFYTDQDADGYAERFVIEVSGTNLLVTNEEANGRARQQAVWSDSNANIAENVALFRYYDADGVEITDMGEVSQSATHIVVTIVVSYDDTTLQDARTVFMRNH
ncbi:MAG: prepilin-type N-terminal cleavage/methylation domain-containing protein [Coriobacteriia bacterium]|nr:prepilin-type N-terminal cleavage/methylation domain-containing protein [Coriobacteriia bacterium]